MDALRLLAAPCSCSGGCRWLCCKIVCSNLVLICKLISVICTKESMCANSTLLNLVNRFAIWQSADSMRRWWTCCALTAVDGVGERDTDHGYR